MVELGVGRPTFYFDAHGEINTGKTIELARLRAEELGLSKIVVASETGLSALSTLVEFPGAEVIIVTSAAGTFVEGSVIGDLRIGISDDRIMELLKNRGARIVRGDRSLVEPDSPHGSNRRVEAGDDVL